MPAEPSPRELDALARRYLAKIARRYAGAVAGFVALALVLILVPSVPQPDATSTASDARGFGVERSDGRAASNDDGAVAGAGERMAEVPNASDAVDSGAESSSRSAAPGAPLVVTTPGAPGVARTGVECGEGVRQFPWSSYAPICVPAFIGSNGGATSRGVTDSTITVTYRTSNSGQSAAVNAATGGGDPNAVQDRFFEDLGTFSAYFNQQFELYGRKVVLKKFQGRGDWVAEYQDQNQEGAQADAVTARDLGAFADISSFLIGTTPAYAKALADQRIISSGGVASSRDALERDAPFVYTAARTADDVGFFDANLACQRMAGLPAIFAGDETMHAKERVFGIVNPDNPDYRPAGDTVHRALKECGGKVGRRVSYAIDIPTMAQQSTNVIAQMKAAGVTTVICICDNVVPIFMTRAATQQQYWPEWMPMWNGDNDQNRDQDQWAHALSGAYAATVDPKTTEAYRVYKQANPDGEPAQLPSIGAAYLVAMLLYDGLQAAGPDLNPATFEHGFFSLPPSLPDALLPWEFGPTVYSPVTAFRLTWWDPATRSASNGNNGAWRDCGGADGGFKTTRRFDPAAYGPPRTQLQCFDR